jgi:enamine deaminase RidA (YjgF/YER057c/UK114 family)
LSWFASHDAGMSHTIVNPAELHDPVSFGYSHTATVPAGAELVFVAGQYASGPDGAVVSADFADQVHQCFANVAIALGAHGLGLGHIVQLRTYVVGLGFEQLGVIAQAIGAAWGATPPTHTVLGVAGLATPDLLVEVEAIAARS